MIALLVAVNQFSLKILPPLLNQSETKLTHRFSRMIPCCLSSFDEFTELLAFAVTSFDFCFDSSPTL